ncbi:hypothetical protein ACFFGT_32910 [Mucilaginibacter angelicae]|uniref:Lipoprotein n=1 Tax=Mucilaginibacter angelicae TaxID=869718 RepID=A0ABV6LI33_9SPHI
MKYLFGIVVVLSLGCKQNAKRVSNKQTDSVVSANNDTTLSSEYLDWYKVKLNGTIDMLSSFKTTSLILGKPDSIVTPNYEDIAVSYFNGEKFKYVYYKGLQFEVVKDSLVFREADFSKDTALYFTSDKIRLSRHTKFDDLKRLFPKAASRVPSDEGKLKYILMDVDVAKLSMEDKWMFWFSSDGNELLKIEYFIPD